MKYASQRSNSIVEAPDLKIQDYVRKAMQNTKVRFTFLFWIIGLLVIFWLPSPVYLDDGSLNEYEELMNQASHVEGYEATVKKCIDTRYELGELKVWFWRSRSPYSTLVPEKEMELHKVEAELAILENKRNEYIQKAKKKVGVWSSYGLEEMRHRFWQTFESGKVFAKQQTFYQMIFRIMSVNNDENLISIVVQWIFTALVNFTFSLIGSLFYFVFSLGSVVYSYQPDPFSAITFYVLGLIGAASVIGGYLIGLYGLTAGAVYAVGKVAVRQMAIEEERKRRLQHAHYE